MIAAADARHRFLALARRALATRRRSLSRALAPVRGTRDPIVAVAFARLALAGRWATRSSDGSRVLARLDPANPLVAAAALDCALRAA